MPRGRYIGMTQQVLISVPKSRRDGRRKATQKEGKWWFDKINKDITSTTKEKGK